MALAERRWSAVTVVERRAEHFGGGRLVDVLVAGEGAQQAFVPRQVRHDAQLDLRIVGRQQHVPRGRDEGLADAPALRRADRDVLQVRILRRQPAGRRHRLVIAGVHAPGTCVDLLG